MKEPSTSHLPENFRIDGIKLDRVEGNIHNNEAMDGVDITDFAPSSLGSGNDIYVPDDKSKGKDDVERLTKGEIEEIEILSNAIIREFLSRRHLFNTLNKFTDEEDKGIHDLSKTAVSTRSELGKRFNLVEQTSAGRKRGLSTFLDVLIFETLGSRVRLTSKQTSPTTFKPEAFHGVKSALRKKSSRSSSITSLCSNKDLDPPPKNVSFDLSKTELIPSSGLHDSNDSSLKSPNLLAPGSSSNNSPKYSGSL